MLNPDGQNRLGIFVMHDACGQVDTFIPYLLADIKENLSMLAVVVNGRLSPEGRRTLEQYADQIDVREDKGYDAWGWKTALTETIGWERIAQFDELLLFNDTFFGPLYPFRMVFEIMARRMVDFWGLTLHYDTKELTGTCRYGYIPEHIQSYFLVVRRRMLKSLEFRRYWDRLPPIHSFWELVCYNEVVFTKYFSDIGFTYDALVETADLKLPDQGNYNFYIHLPFELIAHRKMPVIKRKAFIEGKPHQMTFGDAMEAPLALQYIRRNTNYDESLIWDYLCRTVQLRNLYETLRLDYVLTSAEGVREDVPPTAVFFRVRHAMLLPLFSETVSNIPPEVDLYVLTDTEKDTLPLEEVLARKDGGVFHVLRALECGNWREALLKICPPLLKDYGLACFVHDGLTGLAALFPRDQSICRFRLGCLLGSPGMVHHVQNTFAEESRLGILGVPLATFGMFSEDIHAAWHGDYRYVKKWLNRLDCNVPLSKEKGPFLSDGAFWFRPEALCSCLGRDWRQKDFCGEPALSGTEEHALGRIFPYVAQYARFYSGTVMSPEMAAMQWSNLQYDNRIHPRDIAKSEAWD